MAALAVAILLAQTILNEPGATPPAPLSAPASPPSAAESAAAADPDQTATCRPEPSSGHPRVFGFPSPVQAGSGAGSGAGSVAGSGSAV